MSGKRDVRLKQASNSPDNNRQAHHNVNPATSRSGARSSFRFNTKSHYGQPAEKSSEQADQHKRDRSEN